MDVHTDDAELSRDDESKYYIQYTFHEKAENDSTLPRLAPKTNNILGIFKTVTQYVLINVEQLTFWKQTD